MPTRTAGARARERTRRPVRDARPARRALARRAGTAILLTLHVAETPSERADCRAWLSRLLARQAERPRTIAPPTSSATTTTACAARGSAQRPPHRAEALPRRLLARRTGSSKTGVARTEPPWPTVGVGEYRVRAYSREDVLDSIRQCARELRLTRSTPPTTSAGSLQAAQRSAPRAGDSSCRTDCDLPPLPVSSGGWNAAVRAAMEDGGR